MKHSYKIKHNKILQIIFAVLLIIILIGLIVNIITLVNNIKNDAGTAFPVSWTALIAIQLIAILVLLFNCRYVISLKHFTLVFGFVFKRIPISDLKLIREDKENKIMLLYYRVIRKGEELIDYQAININPKYYDEFINDIKGKNPTIVYENFDMYKNTEE